MLDSNLGLVGPRTTASVSAASASDAERRHSAGGGRLEKFVYDDQIVRMFMTATIVWGLVAFLAGLIIALQMVIPIAASWEVGGTKPLAFLSFLYQVEYLTFGRLRPLHTNAAIFAFAGNSIFTGVYYSLQRLCKARMWSDKLSRLHFWGWQGIIVAAALTLPLGITQGKEYAELEWPIDLAIAVVWLGFFGTNFMMTVVKRRERHMYVAIWFYIASLVTVTVLHVFNNLWVPLAVVELANGRVPSGADWLKSWSVYAGAQDAFMQWWYGHNAVAFFLTTPFLGLMYYFMPKAAERPVYSYRLSIVHFWSLVFMYIWAGPHHLHYTAIPGWLSTLGMVFSVMLWMPSWGGMINGLLTLRGAWNKVASDPVLKFFVAAVTFYGMSTFEGPMLSIKSVNSLAHYTDWVIAHVHSGALGWNGLLTFGMIYWLMPRLFQTEIWSKKLVSTHFWIGTAGILMYVIPIYAAGVTQGLMWRAFDQTGRLAFPDFVETVTRLMPMYWIRVGGGTLFIVGMVMLIVNAVMTWKNRPTVYAEPVHEAPALTAGYADPLPPVSRLQSNPDFARDVEAKVLQGWFHRVWERKPLKFTFLVLVAVGVASLFEVIPTFLIRNNVPSIASVQPYTPLELAGRDIYIAEGCYNCHSQMIRPIWAETKRYGEYSKPGEFVYDHPFQWGSRRIGPDLAREGGKRSHDWHVRHFENPRQLVPQSIMPGYAHLLEQALNFNSIQGRVDSMAMIGVPYGEAVRNGKAVALAKAQAEQIAKELVAQGGYENMADKKVIALVAYMQRLGTDISKPAPAPEAPAAPAAPTATGGAQ
jgi:cytochrome c oxidase cbb3-type subunit I/II